MSVEVLASARQGELTKYPSGSVRELWSISLPLMLSLMSGSLMFFFDRLLLAKYSINALNAATTASTLAAAIQFTFLSTTCIAEVFVGQFNGAKRFSKLGEPVWQMIWFSLLSIFLFIPVAFFAGPYLFHGSPLEKLEIEYFFWLMLFSPTFCLVGAISSFYIGQGKVKFVTLLVIVANMINVALDLVLIYGVEPYIPAIGIAGAAIATGVSQVVQCGLLFYAFLSKKNRETFGTGQSAFVKASFFQCIRIGLPNSIAHTLEILAWAMFFKMMAGKGVEFITVAAISQSVFLLFTFITEGISKGATAIAANLIGAKQWDQVWKLFWSGVKFYFQVFLALGLIFVVFPEPLIRWFVASNSSEITPAVKQSVVAACFWIWLFFLFDGINWLIVGLLTAAGDTKFILKAGGTTIWLFAILPIYLLIVVWGAAAHVAWQLTALYGVLTCIIYYARLQSEKWKTESIELSLDIQGRRAFGYNQGCQDKQAYDSH
jgi:multidrug resistance protein, MATE family